MSQESKKIYVVDHESIRGPEIHKAFFDENLAKEFTETIGCGGIREIEILDDIPGDFMFFVIFENGRVLDKGLWTNTKLSNSIMAVTPNRISVIVNAASAASSVKIARMSAIDFIRKTKMMHLDTGYSLLDGSITQKSNYPTPMPMIEPMREQAIALLEKRYEDALIHSVETVLLFWASPSSIDQLYRFKIVDDEPECKVDEECRKAAEENEEEIVEMPNRLNISIPAAGSDSKIEIHRSDKEEFISIAKRLGFKEIISDELDTICLKRD